MSLDDKLSDTKAQYGEFELGLQVQWDEIKSIVISFLKTWGDNTIRGKIKDNPSLVKDSKDILSAMKNEVNQYFDSLSDPISDELGKFSFLEVFSKEDRSFNVHERDLENAVGRKIRKFTIPLCEILIKYKFLNLIDDRCWSTSGYLCGWSLGDSLKPISTKMLQPLNKMNQLLRQIEELELSKK